MSARSSSPPDTVSPSPLHGSGALGTNGEPLHQSGLSTPVPGLGFVGMEFQRNFSSKTLRGVGRDAEHVLKRLRTAVAG
ncbi:hypothetical protein OG978_02160 [Streptomyces sp. NBC_01591]|uniref:hypothetical protein n=1 Tax=Streptomyces sp. NBC_01591 TaxID=2975888 RepID=UPI002DDAF63A|nr:hypothetical protein [Streptomyces sp. NBC_01591]WSD73594.1 hypothetical protein OG978_02160 [Streptomyces sp. NBC_01591]